MPLFNSQTASGVTRLWTHERQTEGGFCFVTGQSRCRVEHRVQFRSRWAARCPPWRCGRDLVQLLAIGQLMLNDQEQLLQFRRDGHDGREDHDERAVLLSSRDLVNQKSGRFRATEEKRWKFCRSSSAEPSALARALTARMAANGS